MNKEKKTSTKAAFLLVTYGILLYMALQNLDSVRNVTAWIYTILQPVVYGLCTAFIINLFMNIFRRRLFSRMEQSQRTWVRKLCPLCCGITTALVAVGIVAMIVLLIIPQFITAVDTLLEKMPSSMDQLMKIVETKLTEWNAPAFLLEAVRNFEVDRDSLLDSLAKFVENNLSSLKTVVGAAFQASASIFTVVTNFVLGVIIAIYVLANKNRVLQLLRKVILRFFPQKYQEKTFRVLRLANQSFADFLTGQMVEAVIIGSLCTIGLTIFRFPYAATIGVLTGITALLPIIGAWIGGGVGALLVWVDAPNRVIWFIIFILALQQIEGQFIYPKVVGNSIGLPGLLVLIAVILGGGFGGIFGIIFAVPVFAILYSLLKEALDNTPQEAAEAAGEMLPAAAAAIPEQTEAEASSAAEPSPPAAENSPKKPRKRHK